MCFLPFCERRRSAALFPWAFLVSRIYVIRNLLQTALAFFSCPPRSLSTSVLSAAIPFRPAAPLGSAHTARTMHCATRRIRSINAVRSRLMPAKSVNSPMPSQARPHQHNVAMPCHQVPGLLVIFRVLPPNGILFFIMIYLLFICSTFRFSPRMHGSPVFFFPSLCYTKL